MKTAKIDLCKGFVKLATNNYQQHLDGKEICISFISPQPKLRILNMS